MTVAEVEAYRANHNNADPPWERMTDKVFGRAKDLTAPYFLCGTLKGRSFFSHVDVIMDGASRLKKYNGATFSFFTVLGHYSKSSTGSGWSVISEREPDHRTEEPVWAR